MDKYKYKAVLFDFDGTLFDTWPALAMALQATYRYYINDEMLPIDALKKFSHLKREDLLTKLLNKPATFEQEDFFINTYQMLIAENLLPYEGLSLTLEYLNNNFIPWGIVTNKPKRYFSPMMEKLALLKTTACLICPEDVENRKPYPDPLIKACGILNLKSNQVIYVGDSILDIKAAAACSMDFVLASYGYIEEEQTDNQKVKYRINCLLELIPIISGQNCEGKKHGD